MKSFHDCPSILGRILRVGAIAACLLVTACSSPKNVLIINYSAITIAVYDERGRELRQVGPQAFALMEQHWLSTIDQGIEFRGVDRPFQRSIMMTKQYFQSNRLDERTLVIELR